MTDCSCYHLHNPFLQGGSNMTRTDFFLNHNYQTLAHVSLQRTPLRSQHNFSNILEASWCPFQKMLVVGGVSNSEQFGWRPTIMRFILHTLSALSEALTPLKHGSMRDTLPHTVVGVCGEFQQTGRFLRGIWSQCVVPRSAVPSVRSSL